MMIVLWLVGGLVVISWINYGVVMIMFKKKNCYLTRQSVSFVQIRRFDDYYGEKRIHTSLHKINSYYYHIRSYPN